MTRDQKQLIANANARIKAHMKMHGHDSPRVGLVLGSGLGDLKDALEESSHLATTDLDGYPASTVEGHAGRCCFGVLDGVPVVMLEGRIHVYEGHDLPLVGLPARILCSLGVQLLVVTNAAGGVNPRFAAGDIMLIEDHLNFLAGSPLQGRNEDAWGPRFPDMSAVYPEKERVLARTVAADLGLDIKQGVYAAMRGPQYETPAEIRMLQALGADAVGMSTVPEAIVAAHMGVPVLGLSLIANPAAGQSEGPLSHQEVLEAAGAAAPRLQKLVRGVIAARSMV